MESELIHALEKIKAYATSYQHVQGMGEVYRLAQLGLTEYENMKNLLSFESHPEAEMN